jgi:hypothetical protein
MDKNKALYNYVFSNGESITMSPIEAHKYAHRKMIDIFQGPGYVKAKREKAFDGFGFHDSLQMNFKGPAHYRQYLKENNMHEASVNDKPMEEKYTKPIWDEDLIRKANSYGLDIGSVLAEALLSGELDYPEGNCVLD